MKSPNEQYELDKTLRMRAEEIARTRGTQLPAALPTDEIEKVLHELRVHQIELEMQNEQLRSSQNELETSRARYFDLYDLAPVGYFTLNDMNLILETNLTTANLLNVTRNALVNKPITRFIFPEDQDIFYALRKETHKDSLSHSCEVRLVVNNKPPLWVRMVLGASCIKGAAEAWRVVVSDISEKRHKEKELAQVKNLLDGKYQELQAIFDLVLEGIIICGLDGSIQKWNPAALAMHELTKKDVDGLNLPELAAMFELRDATGHLLALEERPLSRILRGERLVGLEVHICHTQKVWNRIFSYHGNIITDAQGQKLMAVVTVRDVTRFKQAEAKILQTLDNETVGRVLAESEVTRRQEALEAVYKMATGSNSTLESLFDQVTSSVSVITRAPAAAIYEYRDGKIVRGSQCIDGRVVRIDVPTEPCSACRLVLLENCIQQLGANHKVTIPPYLCFDGSRFKSYVGVPIINLHNTVIGIICVLDEKERVFEEHEIKFIEVFGRYVANEVLRFDMESRLRGAEKMQLLGQITSGVAHEVRNPLTGILAIISVLSKELSGNDLFTQHIKHMRTQVSRLTHLMEDLLLLGKPVKEENVVDVSLVTLTDLALSTWLQTQSEQTPIVQFVKPNNPSEYLVRVDASQITQVIINLLENAQCLCPSNAPLILSVFKVENEQVALTIKDFGPGISPDILLRIFDPFFTTRKGGTGLGLSIVRQIVASHMGSVTATNNINEPGALFEVRLPLFVRKAT